MNTVRQVLQQLVQSRLLTQQVAEASLSRWRASSGESDDVAGDKFLAWLVKEGTLSDFSPTGKGKDKDKVAGQETKGFPVDSVSWVDAVEFCRKLSDMPQERAAGRMYRLPSEAQWEYACRAGNLGRYSFSLGKAIPKEYDEKALADYGWFRNNSGGRSHAVGEKRPNVWGLYDMHGNLWEWCQDWYGKNYYANSPTDDPAGPSGGSGRVECGGVWIDPAGLCWSAYRDGVSWHGDLRRGFPASLVCADK